ncbi:MAG TPA: hypothetical protein VGR28_14360 [Candidatus Thermoplasmatota archaeon]|jgi:hypothetical protein|nr:hypothetical protein [Candidatus Thermoplasmatota archaeon]
MAPEEAPCQHCGAVLPLATLLRIDAQGEYVLACPDCAVAIQATGRRGR